MLVLYLTTPMYRCRLTLVSHVLYILLSHDVHFQIDPQSIAGEKTELCAFGHGSEQSSNLLCSERVVQHGCLIGAINPLVWIAY